MRLGIDLGGTKIAALVLREDGGSVWESRMPTPREDYDGTIAAVGDLVASAERAVGAPCTVGIGMPGAISPMSGLVKNANSTWLNGRRFHQDLEERLGREVRLANDANCLAVSEAIDGAAAGAHVVFGAILGTGVGGGIAIDGRVITGANAIAGEWGHNPMPWPLSEERPGPPCYCGRSGCMETLLSGPALSRDHRQRSDADLDASQLAGAAEAGDATARATLDTWIERLSRGFASVINLLDPDVIVVGGGLSNVGRLYVDVPRQWARWVFSDRVDTRLVPAMFGDASGVRGAARLWP